VGGCVDLILDWRIVKTFKLILLEEKKIKNISSISLRGCYIRATANQSKSSFSDFVERCIALKILEAKNFTYLINQKIWDLLENEN